MKVKGTITWLGVHDAVPAEFRLYDRLFTEEQPDAGGRDFLSVLNPQSKRVVSGYVEAWLGSVDTMKRFQFERHGYFVAEPIHHSPAAPVFGRITGLKGQ